jgi:hypothetical protein
MQVILVPIRCSEHYAVAAWRVGVGVGVVPGAVEIVSLFPLVRSHFESKLERALLWAGSGRRGRIFGTLFGTKFVIIVLLNILYILVYNNV